MNIEATREDLLKAIRSSINDLAIEKLQGVPEKINKMKVQTKEQKAQRMQDAENALFTGFDRDLDNHRKIRLNEEEKTKVSDAEIGLLKTDFVEKLAKKLNGNVPSIKFDVQSDSGRIMSFPQVPEGKEFFMSGSISFGSGKVVVFSFSFLNGMKITTKDFIVDKENRKIVDSLYDMYMGWKNEWNERLTSKTVAAPTAV